MSRELARQVRNFDSWHEKASLRPESYVFSFDVRSVVRQGRKVTVCKAPTVKMAQDLAVEDMEIEALIRDLFARGARHQQKLAQETAALG